MHLRSVHAFTSLPCSRIQRASNGLLEAFAAGRAPKQRTMAGDQTLDRSVKDRRSLVIEAGERLVHQHDFGLGEEGHRDPQALALAHRHAIDPALSEIAQIEFVDGLLDPGADARWHDHRNAGPEFQLVTNGEARVEAAVASGQERHKSLVAGAILARL